MGTRLVFDDLGYCHECLASILVEVDASISEEEGGIVVKCERCGAYTYYDYQIVTYLLIGVGYSSSRDAMIECEENRRKRDAT